MRIRLTPIRYIYALPGQSPYKLANTKGCSKQVNSLMATSLLVKRHVQRVLNHSRHDKCIRCHILKCEKRDLSTKNSAVRYSMIDTITSG
ncbi:hypothetical protein CEXT_143861 [Caerostris extrusa]|uniref:Uncharacterized protein n=1 Tax=Caerostris extrusa TaxID=172846 RepID=A0AAV4WCQ0_CAEEX|nr:hypothetical protein CEXT_143861 [Caerostris extrusa]